MHFVTAMAIAVYTIFNTTSSASAAAVVVDPSTSSYTCDIFDRSGGASVPKQSVSIPVHGNVVVPLADGQHEIALTWFNWTLNANIRPVGVVRELLGAASHLHFKLRSHAPGVSLYCSNDQLAKRAYECRYDITAAGASYSTKGHIIESRDGVYEGHVLGLPFSVVSGDHPKGNVYTYELSDGTKRLFVQLVGDGDLHEGKIVDFGETPVVVTSASGSDTHTLTCSLAE